MTPAFVRPRVTLAWSCALAVACSTPPPSEPDPSQPRAAGAGSGSQGGAGGGQPVGGSSSGGSGAPSGGGGAPSGATGGGGGSGASAGSAGAGPGVAGVLGHPNAATAYPKRDGFTLALVEEFDSALDLDKDPIWTWSDGGLPEGGVRFAKDAISFKDGKLVITASKQNMPGSDSYAEPVTDGPAGFVPTKPLKSGELRTKFNNFRYGRYEARLQPPTSSGNFISTLFAFRTPKFQDWREIDIELTADKPTTVGTNIIYANNVGAWNESIQEFFDMLPQGAGAMGLPGGFNHQGAFHTYAFEWLPDSITWFVDDVPVRKKTGGGLPIPEKSAKIIMNLWVFATAGGFGGDPTKNAYPLSAQYDWFRFYRWDGDKSYPCASPPGCLAADDRDKSKNNASDGLDP
jgi:hypothetical protein